MKDIYGAELAEGDKVLFATKSGGLLREGVFLREGKNGNAVVRPFFAYGKPVTRTKYLNLNTGKFTDPSFHVKKKAHWVHKETRAEVTNNQFGQYIYSSGLAWNAERKINPDYVPREDREYVPVQYNDYIATIEIPGGPAIVFPRGSEKIAKLRSEQ